MRVERSFRKIRTGGNYLSECFVRAVNASVLIGRIPFPPRSQDPSSAEATDGRLIRELKIEFDSSSDQFGRITLYQLEILG